MSVTTVAAGPSDGFVFPTPPGGLGDGDYLDVLVTSGGTAMTVQSIGGVAFGDAATANIADIVAAAVTHINDNYFGLLDAAALAVNPGDILVFNGTSWKCEPVGADTTVLTADSGQPNGVTWA